MQEFIEITRNTREPPLGAAVTVRNFTFPGGRIGELTGTYQGSGPTLDLGRYDHQASIESIHGERFLIQWDRRTGSTRAPNAWTFKIGDRLFYHRVKACYAVNGNPNSQTVVTA